jgi:putative salt-induced outer membrane protein YdiY
MNKNLILAGGLLLVTVPVLAEEAAAPKPLEASIALGVTVNDGNANNESYNASVLVNKLYGNGNSSRLALDGNYAESENEKTTENAKAATEYRHILSDLIYAGFSASIETDDLADLDYRYVIAPSLGYFFIKNDAATMTADIGPALIGEKKAGETEERVAIRLSERYERTLETSARVFQSLEFLPNADDFDIYILNAEIGVEAPISEKLNVRLTVRNTYDSDPAPGREQNDVSVIGALAYSLF